MAQGCVLLALFLRTLMAEWIPISVGPSIFIGIQVAAFLLPLGFTAAGLYPGYGMAPVERLRRRVIVTVVAFGLFSLFDYLALGGQWSRGILLIAVALAVVALPAGNEIICFLLRRLGWWGEPVAVYGVPERAQAILSALKTNRGLGWRPVGTPTWPPPRDPPDGIDLAILVPPPDADLPGLLDRMHFRRVVIVPHLGVIQSQWVAARDTGIGPGLELRRNLLHPFSQFLKRGMDLVLVIMLAPVALPVVAGFALLVTVCSPGVPFYSQQRMGRDGKEFRLWKIRSMVPDADNALAAMLDSSEQHRKEWETHMKLADDPRVIPVVGRLMRRWSIDELPQLFNVLTGDMSLVGPRPLPHYHVEAVSPEDVALRTRVLPGITGLAQVSGRSAQSVGRQIAMDTYYIRNWSFWLDYYILMRTAAHVLAGEGAY